MTLQLRADVSTADTDDGLVLLDERAGRYWQLNYQQAADAHDAVLAVSVLYGGRYCLSRQEQSLSGS
ncbi:MAG TPA: hypothetical protein VGO16_07530 [Pseudonocardiaceae bacterium]|jgi:hypothetical protein|nr:hypothetical protein [Pseudonocardiaceae bacterium]